MDSIPPILSSARNLFATGFCRANTAAQHIVDDPGDPVAYVDLINARTEVGAASILVRTFQQMTNDLFNAVNDAPPHDRRLDLYA